MAAELGSVTAAAMQTALDDLKRAVEGYVNKIGFSILAADSGAAAMSESKLVLGADEVRFDSHDWVQAIRTVVEQRTSTDSAAASPMQRERDLVAAKHTFLVL